MLTRYTKEKTNRRIYGITPNGKRIYLGSSKLDEQEIQKILDRTVETYVTTNKGYLNIKSSVYNLQGFIGIEFKPRVYK